MGVLANEELIQELLNIVKDIQNSKESCNDLGLSNEELAFYDTLTKPAVVKDFY